jgi:anti-sigma regulatory factor (Ser/Thr protein kinase)
MLGRHTLNHAAAGAVGLTSQTVVVDHPGPTVPSISRRDNLFAVVVAATPANVTKSRHEFARWMRAFALAKARTDEILLAVTEAVTNAIEHGSGCDGGKFVSIRASLHDQSMTATVSDSGHWISPAARPPAVDTHRGRGLILIDAFADNVDIVRAADGTRITMQFDTADR